MAIQLRIIVLVFLTSWFAGCASNGAEAPGVGGEPEAALIEGLSARAKAGDVVDGLLFWSQPERRVAFGHVDQIFPTRTIQAGDSPYALTSQSVDLSDIRYQVDGKQYSLADFRAMDAHVGLIVVQDDTILAEHYSATNTAETRWISFSVSKSVTSMLIGAAIKDGFIESVDDPVINYLPRLRGTAYEHTTIKNVLNMASGVKWNEDYADRDSDVAKAGGLNGVELVKYLATLPAEVTPGEKFNYSTGETNLVGEILRAAIGNNASTYLSKKIWKPFGMGADATWLLGGEDGGELGGCCISATLRDYARIGLFALHNGQLKDSTEVLPENWIQQSTAPSLGMDGYGYLWWLFGSERFAALGIFGQQIFVEPKSNLVIAMHSNAPTAVDSEYSKHQRALVQALFARFSR